MSSLSRRVVSLKLPASVLVEMSDELLEICRQYGYVYQYVLDLARDQLLIEVEELSAKRLFNKFKRAPPQLGGYAIRVSSTTRQEMIRAQVESHEKAASKKVSEVKSTKPHDFNPTYLRAEGGSTSAVLCAHVDKETAEVTHDVLRQAFGKYGRVVSLISYRHKATLHCLVQYPDTANAGEGLRKLNGMHIYDDCCILRVFYSNLPNLAFTDDGRGYRKLIHHNPHVELSKKTVTHLQVWNPDKGATTDQNRTKEASRKVTHAKIKGNDAPLDRIPKIPKLSAINNCHNTSRPQQSHNATPNSRDPKSDVSKGYYKITYTPIKPKPKRPSTSSKHKQQKITKSSDKLSPLCKTLTAAGRNDNDSLHKCDEANTVKTASPNSSSDDKASSNDRTNTVDRPSSLDATAFTLSLDPSDCSDIDTDASVSSACDSSKRLVNSSCQPLPISCHSVETAVGCQDIRQSSMAIQCSMEDDELKRMANSCREQLDELKKKSFSVEEMEGCNKKLLLENANLKKLLNEVQSEMRRLKEIISNGALKVDASTQVDPNMRETIVQDEVQQLVAVNCDKANKQTCSPKTSVGSASRNLHKRSSPCSDPTYDPTYEPYKKKQKKKSKSSSPPSSVVSPQNNAEKTSGYAKRIRSKFLHTHLQSFLKSQKFIKSKLDTMKEAMKSCSGDLHESLSKIVPQFESMYDITVKLSDLEQSKNEHELFSCISKLSTVFPSLIADLSESLVLKVPGLSPLTILSVLKKMEYLATEMSKYSLQSTTLAYGNANTGETTSVESSLSSSCCNTPTTPTPPPLVSLDEAVEMLDVHHSQQANNESVECITSLTVSISTKFLQRIGGKRLFSISDDSVFTDEAENGAPNGNEHEVQTDDHNADKQLEVLPPTSVEKSHDDVLTVLPAASTTDGDESIDIEVVQNDQSERSDLEEAVGETGNKDSNSTCIPEKEIIGSQECSTSMTLDASSSNNVITSSVPVSFTQCTIAPPNNSTSQTAAAMPTHSANPNANTAAVENLPPFSAIPSIQRCSTNIVPMHNSAPPTYNSFCSQPHSSIATTGGFIPLLPQPYIPTPIINISRSIGGLVVKWTLEQLDIHLASQVHSYCVCVFQGDRAPDPDFWHTIGEVQAMKLPMACTLKCFEKGKTYHFAVRAISRDGIRGQFSQSKIIQIY